ncbi:MAG: DUF4296 domain-containing protein [Saprospiraceae bacterium]|nr:DUF4296 domain-containing protein [Saprospiraceae bacterium]
MKNKMNQYRVLFCAALLSLLLACQKKVTLGKLPISEEKLIAILLDTYIAENAAQPYYGEEKDSLMEVYYAHIATIHQVTLEQVNETLDMLQKDPTKLDLVYSKVLEK